LGPVPCAWLAGAPDMSRATVLFLITAAGLGLGNGAVFKLVAQYYPKNTGLVTGIVGCAGGLGGFSPPLVLGFVKDTTHSYALGFVFLAIVAAICLGVLIMMRRQQTTAATNPV